MPNSFLDNLKLPFNAIAHMAVTAAENPGEFMAETFTPYGNYVSVRDAKDDFSAGNYGWGSFNALMALPGLGMLKGPGRAWRRTKGRTPAAPQRPPETDEGAFPPRGLLQTDEGAFMRADNLADYALSQGRTSPTLNKLVAEIENKLGTAKPYETPDHIKAFEAKIKAANKRIETAATLR